jgi:hypothetical protein
MVTNRINYAPAAKTVRGRIMNLSIAHAAVNGGTRSLPAEIGSSRLPSRIRQPSRKEHPEAPSTSLPSLEPVEEPVSLERTE